MKFTVFFVFFFFLFLYILNGDPWRLLPRIKSVVKNFFSEKGSPFNLAIFRIILFLFILTQLQGLWATSIGFSQLPSEMRVVPIGMNTLLSIVPINPALVEKSLFVFTVACILAMFGCFARWTCFIAAISGIYVMGISQCYGKVDHNHHLIWFMLILSASRCADVLSIDSLWQARKRMMSRIPNSVEYALPLRFIWLLIAMIYFFPGFWKLAVSADWAWSDNLKYHLYAKWFELDGWLPFFRLDQYPVLYKAASLGIIIFELFFVVFIFFPTLRPIAVTAGLFFHTMIYVFMKISFFNLLICYVAFINWDGLLARISKSNPEKMNYNPSKKSALDQKIIIGVGSVLLMVNCFFGFKETIAGWPFACYPTFANRITEARVATIEAYGVKGDQEELISFKVLKQQMEAFRFTSMINGILAMPEGSQKNERLKTLIILMQRDGMDLSRYSKIHFYKMIYSSEPDKSHEPAISKELLAEVTL